ncbi:MAG TPA: ethanolamine ammonia-lyase subunit EutC [Hyphomicrobiaceae bacterium]|nr:ethanolamine ammonia-lyase subunit EutC [Hyphomicrobiaceae bacterium]
MIPDDASDDIWRRLTELTPARIALGRTGSGLPTRASMKFALAHAQARDAVHAPLDAAEIAAGLTSLGLVHVIASSRAVSRHSYLLRPDLGRRLDAVSRDAVAARRATGGVDIAVVIADGLSARAVHTHAIAMTDALLPLIRQNGWSLAPIVIATQGRVAIGDEIGALLGARLALVMIGERPGLSSPDSLGMYLTFSPEPGRTDGERNCLSNIHGAGMSVEEAAFKAAWLMREAFVRRLTGVALKDESGAFLPNAPEAAARALPPGAPSARE